MGKLKTVLAVMAVVFVFGLMHIDAFAQEDISGRWEGTFIWAGNVGVKNETYDWDEGKWLNTNRRAIRLALELEQTEDGRYKGKYTYGDYGSDQMRFEATFADSMMKGSTVGSAIKGEAQWGGYLELTWREADGKRYLEGSWRKSEKTAYWEGRVALRREDGN